MYTTVGILFNRYRKVKRFAALGFFLVAFAAFTLTGRIRLLSGLPMSGAGFVQWGGDEGTCRVDHGAEGCLSRCAVYPADRWLIGLLYADP